MKARKTGLAALLSVLSRAPSVNDTCPAASPAHCRDWMACEQCGDEIARRLAEDPEGAELMAERHAAGAREFAESWEPLPSDARGDSPAASARG